MCLLLLFTGSFALLYHEVLTELVSDWATDDNYSHGFIIVPLATYFVWERRERLASAVLQPSVLGLFAVLCSLAAFVAGMLGAELFLTRVSMVGTIAGSVLYICGWQHLRTLAFPIAFLLLMIPIPAIIFNQVAFPLQLLASEVGGSALLTMGVPVLREGNIIVLPTTSLEVVEACSGLRSLISLVTLSIVYGYFTRSRTVARTIIALGMIPVAIAANGLRITGTGVVAHYQGAEAAQGFFHTFSGWLVFLVALAMLFFVERMVSYFAAIASRLRKVEAPLHS